MEFDDQIIAESKAMASSQGAGIFQKVLDLILSKPDKLLLQAMETRSRKPAAGQALMDYARALLLVLGPSARRSDSSRSASLLLRLVVKLLDVVQEIRISEDRKFMDCLDLILQELDALPQKSLPYIVEAILQKMENPSFASNFDADDGIALQLLPQCLSLIATSSQLVEVPGPDETVSFVAGSDYTDRAFKRMLSSTPWSKSVLMKIANMLRDMPLDEGHLVEFLNTILGQMKNVEPVDLPALVYQLLLLASKGSKRVILFGILSFFSRSLSASSDVSKMNKTGKKFSAESCRQVEGTILLHINFAVKQNPALGQEILVLVRTRSLPLTSFIVSVILSLARIQRFEEPSMNLLKAAAIKSYQDWKLCRYSSCAPSGVKKQCLEDVQNLEQSFMKTVHNTAFGWDHVVPSLVSFGFTMVELQPGDSSSCDQHSKHFQSSGCREFGALILRNTFEVHELARDEIIEQSKCRIIGLKPEQSSPIIKMIGQLVQDHPHLMLEHVSRLKECLDYYTFLHPISASFLIHSIGSLFQLSSDLQGYAVLVLRKAMFGREATARINALQGLINLLIAERCTKAQSGVDSLLNSSSEASCSQQERGCFRRTPSLLQELQGLLRRCLLQQAKIRELLYRGLIKLVLVDPTAADIAFNLLWPHFCRYFKANEDSDITLDMSCCLKTQINGAAVEEPLDHLIFAVHNLLTLQPHEEEGHNTCQETCFDFSLSQDREVGRMSAAYSLKDAFLNLKKKFIHNSLSDLNIDKSQNFTPETLEGKINLEKANIYLGVYEILIDAAVSQLVKCQRGSKMDEAEKDLQSCVSTYFAIEEILQKHANSCGSKLRTVESSAQFGLSAKSQPGFGQSLDKKAPFLSAANGVYLLNYAKKCEGDVIPPKNISSTSQNDGVLKDLTSYRYKLAFLAIRACLRHVKAASISQDEDPSEIKGLGGDWKVLGKPVLETLTAAVTMSSGVFSWSVEKKEREKQGRGRRPSDEAREGLILILVKCLGEICSFAIKKNCFMEVFGETPSNLQVEDRLQEEGRKVNESTDLLSEQLFIQEFLSKKAQPVLEQLLHRSQFREFEVLSGVILSLGSKLQPHQMKVFGSWAESNSKSMKLTYNGAAKALVKICLCLSPPPDDLILAQTLSQELLKVIGTDEQEPIEISGTFHTINTSTKNCIASLLLQHLEAILTDVEWLISKLKLYPSTKFSDLLVDLLPQTHFETSRLESEVALHKRLESIVVVLSNFVQMSSSGAVAEHFLKVAVKLYKCLAAATKLCIAPKGFKQTVPSTRFQHLAEVTGKRLTAPLYTFMAVMQRDQQENCPTKGAVSKIKREVRTIPNLVFHVEDYERYLIQLSRLTKVNLLRHAKRSTARDFKILENGKKCKQPDNNQNTREEAVVADVAEESEKEADSQEEQDSEQEQNGLQDGVSVENEDTEEQIHSMKIRRPMEKRRRKAVVRDSDDDDDEAEGSKRQRG